MDFLTALVSFQLIFSVSRGFSFVFPLSAFLCVPFPFSYTELEKSTPTLLSFVVILSFEMSPYKFAMPVVLGSTGHSEHCNGINEKG